jgi:OFA family oxalate/formate antiporter-like MFS transporter
MVFGLSAAIMSPIFVKLLISLGYISMNLSIAILTLVAGFAGAYLARPPVVEEEIDASVRSLSGEPLETRQAGWDSWSRSLTVEECLHTQSFWFLWITWTLAGAAGVSMSILATAYGLSKGFDLGSAILILIAFNFTNGTGRIISGFFSDKIGRNRTMSMAFLAAALAYFVLPFTGDVASCAFLASIVGFAHGTLFSVSAPLIADSFGLKHFGAIFGLAFAAYGFVAGPLGPMLSGYMLDATNDNFFLVFSYLGVFYLISGFCVRMVTQSLH